jgi:phage-related protein (TIGR01555 family)
MFEWVKWALKGYAAPAVPASRAVVNVVAKKKKKKWPERLLALAKLKSKQSIPFTPFTIQKSAHPDSTSSGLAMDEAMSGYGEWANGTIAGRYDEGEAFPGYPELALLATQPEYRKASQIFARHMTRKWIKFFAKGKEDKTVRISKMQDEMTRLRIRDHFCKLAEQDGYFGRAHLYVDTGATDNPDELAVSIGNGADETSKAKIVKGSLKGLKTVEAVWCYPTNYNSNNPLADDWYNPTMWMVQGQQIHHTRLLKFVSNEVSDLLKPAYSFGGISLSQLGKRSVDNWKKIRRAVSEIICAFNVFVLKLNMTEATETEDDEVFKRAELFNNLKENLGLLMIDGDEEFESVSSPLTGLEELAAQAQEHCAADWSIPLEEYLGLQPTGLNASSEGSLRIFYDLVHSKQESFFRPHLTTVLNFMQLSLFGDIDPDIGFEFEDLMALTSLQLSEKQQRDAVTHQTYADLGAVSAGEIRTVLTNDPLSPYDGLDPEDMPPPPEFDPEEHSGEHNMPLGTSVPLES